MKTKTSTVFQIVSKNTNVSLEAEEISFHNQGSVGITLQGVYALPPGQSLRLPSIGGVDSTPFRVTFANGDGERKLVIISRSNA